MRKKNPLFDIFIYSLTFFQFIYFYSCENWEIFYAAIKLSERFSICESFGNKVNKLGKRRCLGSNVNGGCRSFLKERMPNLKQF